ncbi:hypothetical protein ACFY64_15240 [Streptomyces collinus]|uniref:hypothetical protein n=1 Tax=Streptomyces collinus TaxID=42684 RepID=UPI0036C75D9E
MDSTDAAAALVARRSRPGADTLGAAAAPQRAWYRDGRDLSDARRTATSPRNWAYQHLTSATAWFTEELPHERTGHGPMYSRPADLATYLDAIAAGR